MTDQPMDPRDDRLDDVDAPRDVERDNDEPVVNLDKADDEPDAEHETADDKYIQVIDGRPETTGHEVQGGVDTAAEHEAADRADDTAGDPDRDPDELGFKGDMYTTEPGTERSTGGSTRA